MFRYTRKSNTLEKVKATDKAGTAGFYIPGGVLYLIYKHQLSKVFEMMDKIW